MSPTMLNDYINLGVQYIIDYSHVILLPIMVFTFVTAAFMRLLIYFLVRCEAGFSHEFEKRVHKHLSDPTYETCSKNFHTLSKRLLERTFEEVYKMKKRFRRRRFDQLTCVTDRIFMVPEGSNRLLTDTLSQTKYLRKGGAQPAFLSIAKWAFESNPVFNRVLGILPLSVVNEIINILPGLFVIGGIFGTFAGAMRALPMLGEINITNAEATKQVMDAFLLKIAFSMGSSSLGIILSLSMTLLNATLNPDGLYHSMVNGFASSLEFIWNDTTTNEITQEEESGYTIDRRGISFGNSGLQNQVKSVYGPQEAPPLKVVALNPLESTAPPEKSKGVVKEPSPPEERKKKVG